jgi:uncharacterized protein (TIRG00374 family)
LKRNLQILLGLVIGIGLLWFLFRDTDWNTFWQAIWNADPLWLLVAQIPIWASFILRVQRWHYIVRSTKPVRFGILFNATQIGFLANFVLPLRAGELIRALIVARRAQLPFTRGVAFVAMDRVADLFGLAACMLITLAALQIPGSILPAPGALGSFTPGMVRSGTLVAFAVLVALVTALVLLYANRGLMLRINDRLVGLVSRKLAASTHTHLEQFAHGLSVLRSPGDMLKAIFWSMLVWGTFILSTAAFLKAFGVDFPWYTPFLIQVLVAVAVSIPGPPGFVGQFHVAFVAGILMTVSGAVPDEAKAIAITAHLLNMLATVAVGIACLLLEQAGLLELTRQSVQAQQTAEEQAE